MNENSKSGWILFAVCILGVMIQIDYTAVNVALIAISHSIHADLNLVQWALSAYVLAWGALVLTAGRCADLFGKRRTFLIGTFLFMLGSAFTGMATAPWFLIFGRVIQGIGGALFLPGLYTLVFTAFPENRRGFALGVLTSSIAIGLAIGPTFGGVVIHLLNWRWIFFLNLPLGIPVIAIILWAVKKEPLRVINEPMDFLGALLVALALVIMMVALNQIHLLGISSARVWSLLILSVLIIAFFILYESRLKFPLIQLEMFKNKNYIGCLFNYVVMGFSFSTVLIVGGLYLENVLEYSPLHTGFIFLVMTAMFAWLSVYSGKLVDKVGSKLPIIAGGIFTTLSFLVLAACDPHSPLWMPVLVLALFGVGGGLGFPALNANMLKSMPAHLLSTASSAYAMFGTIGNTIGLILSSVIIVSFGEKKLNFLLAHSGLSITPSQTSILQHILGTPHYSPEQLKDFTPGNIPMLLDTLRASFVHGMTIVVLITTVLCILGVVVSVLMIRDHQPVPSGDMNHLGVI
jgi:EmrB/QacA subfamily drug resistance transporter